MSSDFQIPDGLTELDQWLVWRRETVRGREAKVPYSVRGARASVVEPRDMTTFEEAVSTWRRHGSHYQGVGFVFVAGGGLVGVDLDDCMTDGVLKEWARRVVERFADTYMEISPSGAGLKIFCRGVLPANLPGVPVVNNGGSVEAYDHARYFTVTGQVFRGPGVAAAPLQVEDHAEDVLHLYQVLTKSQKKVWPLQPMDGGRIPAGQQHSTLVSIAGTLRARRVCDEAILACLLSVNAHQCERPGPVENIARIVRSSRAWVAR